MDAAIIYHSETGNTERFVNSLADALTQKGHTVKRIKLQTTQPVKQASVRDKQEISFTNLPDIQRPSLSGPSWTIPAS